MYKRMTMVLALLLSAIGADVCAREVVDSIGKEEGCPTIDSLISAQSRDVLKECMRAIDGIQGQVTVIDARTADVLAWGTLEKA